jgi:hypothetical protein
MGNRNLFFGGLLIGLAACTSAPTRPAQELVWHPLAPASLGASRTVTQVLRAAFADREITLNCVVTVDSQSMTIIGLTAIGARVFTLKFDGTTMEVHAAITLPPQFKPERLLEDVQLAYWNLATLQSALAGTDWQVSEPAERTRRLKRAGRLIAEVHYADADPWTGKLWLANFASGYSLSIESKAP